MQKGKILNEITLDDYVKLGTLTEIQKNILIQGISDKKNILIAGKKGSGKTDFINALINEMILTRDRVIILENIPKIQSKRGNIMLMKTTNNVNMSILLKTCMRYRPDRIVTGEICSEEALDILTAWNTIFPGGMSTITSDTLENALKQLESYIQLKSVSKQQELIATAVDYLIFMTKGEEQIKTITIKEIYGFKNGEYILKDIK